MSYIIFYKHRVFLARVSYLGDYIVSEAMDKHTQISNSVGAKILRPIM